MEQKQFFLKPAPNQSSLIPKRYILVQRKPATTVAKTSTTTTTTAITLTTTSTTTTSTTTTATATTSVSTATAKYSKVHRPAPYNKPSGSGSAANGGTVVKKSFAISVRPSATECQPSTLLLPSGSAYKAKGVISMKDQWAGQSSSHRPAVAHTPLPPRDSFEATLPLETTLATQQLPRTTVRVEQLSSGGPIHAPSASPTPPAPPSDAGQLSNVIQLLNELKLEVQQLNKQSKTMAQDINILTKTCGSSERMLHKVRDRVCVDEVRVTYPVSPGFELPRIESEEQLREFERLLEEKQYQKNALSALQSELQDWDYRKRIKQSLKILFEPAFLVPLRWSDRYGSVAIGQYLNVLKLLAKAASAGGGQVALHTVKMFCQNLLKKQK